MLTPLRMRLLLLCCVVGIRGQVELHAQKGSGPLVGVRKRHCTAVSPCAEHIQSYTVSGVNCIDSVHDAQRQCDQLQRQIAKRAMQSVL